MHSHGPGTTVGILVLVAGILVAVSCGAFAFVQERRTSRPNVFSRALIFRLPLVLFFIGLVGIYKGITWI